MREDRITLLKYVIVGAVGFGIGGVIWCLVIMLPQLVVILTTPFDAAGGVALGGVGGASLALITNGGFRKLLNIFRLALYGAIGFPIGFTIGGILHQILKLLLTGSSIYTIFKFSLPEVVALVLSFTLAGAIGGMFYGIALRKNLGSFFLHGAVGFGIGSLTGLMIGNILEMALGPFSETVSLITFMTIGIFIGIFLARSTYLAEKELPLELKIKGRMTKEDSLALLKHVFAGMVGFGIGNALIANLLITNPFGHFTIFDFLICIFGSITCGALLGITSKDVKKALKLSMAGVIWFIIGFVVYFPLMFIAVIFGRLGAFFILPLVIGMIGEGIIQCCFKEKNSIISYSMCNRMYYSFCNQRCHS